METKITFKNGTEIIAEQNGDCFIVDSKPTFPADLSFVEAGERTFKNAFIIECASVDGRYWFTFGEMTAEEVWRAEVEDALCELSMGE